MRAALSLAGAVALLCVAASARAEPAAPRLPHALRLEYSRAPSAAGCPTEQVFRWTVGASMSFDPFTLDAKARLVVALRSGGRLFTGEAKIIDEAGKEVWSYSIPATDCHVVTDALGLMIGASIDLPKLKPPPLAPINVSFILPPSEAPKQKQTFEVGAGAALALGKTPAVAAPELSLELKLRLETFSIAVDASFVPRIGGADTAYATRTVGSHVTMGLAPCEHWGWFFACGLLGFSVLSLSVTERGANVLTGSWTHGTLGGRVGAEVSLHRRVGLRFFADLTVATRRELVTLEGEGSDAPQTSEMTTIFWGAAPVAGAFGLKLATIFNL